MKKFLTALLIGSLSASHLVAVGATEVDEEAIRQQVADIELQIEGLEAEKKELLSQLNENFVFSIQSMDTEVAKVIIHSHEVIDGNLYLFYQIQANQPYMVANILAEILVSQETQSKDFMWYFKEDLTGTDSEIINGYLPMNPQRRETIKEGGSMDLYTIFELSDDAAPVNFRYEFDGDNNLREVVEYSVEIN